MNIFLLFLGGFLRITSESCAEKDQKIFREVTYVLKNSSQFPSSVFMCYQRENINKTSCYNNCSHRFVNKTIGSSIRCQTGNLFDSFPQHLMLMHNGTYFAMNDGNVTSNLQDPNCKIGNIKFLFYNHSGKVQRDLGNWFIPKSSHSPSPKEPLFVLNNPGTLHPNFLL